MESEKEKTVYDSKDLRHLLDQYGIGLENVIYDVSIMQYLTETRTYKDFDQLKQAFGAEGNAAALITLAYELNKKLDETDTQSLYKNIELPLSKVLFDMEKHGFKVDVDMLNEFGEKEKNTGFRVQNLNKFSYGTYGIVMFLPTYDQNKTGNFVHFPEYRYFLPNKCKIPTQIWILADTWSSVGGQNIVNLRDAESNIHLAHNNKSVNGFIDGHVASMTQSAIGPSR